MEINITKLAAISVASACPSVAGTGLSGGLLGNARLRGEAAFDGQVFGYEGHLVRERFVGEGFGNERPTKASAAVAAEDTSAHVAAMAAADAGKADRIAVAGQKQSTTQQTKQHHTMWAFRGPDPWRSPT